MFLATQFQKVIEAIVPPNQTAAPVPLANPRISSAPMGTNKKRFKDLPKPLRQGAVGGGVLLGALAAFHIGADFGVVPPAWKPTLPVWVGAIVLGGCSLAAATAFDSEQEFEPTGDALMVPHLPTMMQPRRAALPPSGGGVSSTFVALADHGSQHILSCTPGTKEAAEAWRDVASALNSVRLATTPEPIEQEQWVRQGVNPAGAYNPDERAIAPSYDRPSIQGTNDDDLQSSDSGDVEAEPSVAEPLPEPLPELTVSSSDSGADLDESPWGTEEPQAFSLERLRQAAAADDLSGYAA